MTYKPTVYFVPGKLNGQQAIPQMTTDAAVRAVINGKREFDTLGEARIAARRGF